VESERKLLSIYSVLTKQSGVVFDFLGIGVLEGEQMFDFMLDFVKTNNACAILLNNFNDFKEKPVKHIKLSIVE